MRKTKEISWGWKLVTALSSLVLALMLGIFAEPFSIVSNAQSQGKVIARSANIRKETNTNSEVVGSVANGDSLTINKQVTASDNTVWYEVFVDANTLGYIRSDLVEITDGTTPPASSGTTTSNETPTATTTDNENMAEVTAVEPVSATVTGSQSVRVRSNASTGSQIVAQAENGLALTVTGQANGTDGKVWYQVNFISDGSEVTGFIRSDYVTLSGELVPATEETNPSEETPQDPAASTKDWDTQNEGDTWYLVDNINSDKYEINNIFETVENNQQTLLNMQEQLTDAQSKAKNQKVIIILLVIVVIIMAGAITLLIFKIKDMIDSAYFAEVEKETLRRRTADRPASSDKKVMHTVGAEKKQTTARPAGAPVQGGARPAGARPAGTPAQSGTRPTGARPAGTPAQGGTKPVGARPAGAPGQGGVRPVGTPAQGGARPTGARPAGTPAQGGTKPAGARPAAAPTQSGAAQAERKPVQQKPRPADNSQNPGWKSKNFMTDDDEFEFEFLNWDGEDE